MYLHYSKFMGRFEIKYKILLLHKVLLKYYENIFDFCSIKKFMKNLSRIFMFTSF